VRGLLIVAALMVGGCAVKSQYRMTKEQVGHGIKRYANQEVVCYEFLGIYNFITECFFRDGSGRNVPMDILKLAQNEKNR